MPPRPIAAGLCALLLCASLAAQTPTAADVPQLLQQLDSADPTVRGAAEIQLLALRDPDAVPPLLAALPANTAHRTVLLRALANFKDARKIPVLIRVARDGERHYPSWQDPIVQQLKELGQPAAQAFMDSFGETCTEEYAQWVGDALAEFEGAGVRLALSGLLEDQDECRQTAASNVLMSFYLPGRDESPPESEGVPLLIAAATSPNRAVRLAAQDWIRKNMDLPGDDFRGVLEPLLQTYHRAQVARTRLAVLTAVKLYADPKVTALMQEAAKDPDPQVQKLAKEWLAQASAGEAVPAPVDVTKAKTPEEKIQAAKQMGDSEDSSNTAALATLLSDGDARVREAAAEAMGTVNAAATDPRGHDERERDTPSANAALVAVLHDPDPRVRAAAVSALGEVNNQPYGGGDASEITPQLLSLSQDADPAVQAALGEALGKIGDPDSVPALVQLAASPAAEVRRAAAYALIRFDQPQATCAKVTLLRDSEESVRASAAVGLFEAFKDGTRCPGDVEALLAGLKDPAENQWLRLPLGHLKDKRAVVPLLEDLKTRGEPSSSYCHDCQALAEISDPSCIEPLLPLLGSSNPVVAGGVLQTLATFNDPRVVAALTGLLRDDRANMRAGAIQGLTRWRQCQLASEFRRALTDESEAVRQEAANAAAQCKDREAVEPLIRLLAVQPVPAAIALGELGDPRAVEPLIQVLQDKKVWGRSPSAHALGQIRDPRAVEALLAALHDNTSDQVSLAEQAAWALAEIGDRRAIPVLQQVVSQAPNLGISAAADAATKALQKLGAPVPQRQGK